MTRRRTGSVNREYNDEALRSFFGGRKAEKPDRPQNVNTPRFIIDAINELWPEGIFLDPCSNATSIVNARYEIFGGGMAQENLEEGHVLLNMSTDPLTWRWPDRTFCNPPYRTLSEWIEKGRPGSEHLFLVPIRENRRWFRYFRARASRFCDMDPFPFLGYKQTFPAPMTLLYFGTRINEFERIFKVFGNVGVYVLCT